MANPTAANDRFVVHKPERDLPLMYIILNVIQAVVKKTQILYLCMIKMSSVPILHFTMKPAGCKQETLIVSINIKYFLTKKLRKPYPDDD